MLTRKPNKREKLELEISQKQEQLKDLDARERTQKRKLDTRRKIVVGALALQQCAINEDFKIVINKLINEHVKKSNDRDLFDLPPLEGQI